MVVVFVAVDSLLWLSVGWFASPNEQAAMIASATALPVAGLGILGTVIGVRRTHAWALDRELLFRFQSERRQAFVDVLGVADACYELRQRPSPGIEQEKDIWTQLNEWSSTIRQANAAIELLAVNDGEMERATRALVDAAVRGESCQSQRAEFVAAARQELRIQASGIRSSQPTA